VMTTINTQLTTPTTKIKTGVKQRDQFPKTEQ
jgi:hypothetical protein